MRATRRPPSLMAAGSSGWVSAGGRGALVPSSLEEESPVRFCPSVRLRFGSGADQPGVVLVPLSLRFR